jgi:soluble lytic murein transglycosylase
MKTKQLLLGLWLALSLAGCNLPTSTPAPTGIASLPPSETSIVPTNSSVPSTETPTPTTVPTISIASGDQALFNGDYTTARNEYRAAYASSGTALVRAAALWGLGRVEYQTGNYAQSLNYLRELNYYYSDSQNASYAYFLLGETMMGLTRYQEAATYFSLYLSLKPGVIDTYVQERIGDAQAALENYPAAVSAYQAALAAPHLGSANLLQVKLAGAIAKTGDTSGALALFDSIAAGSSNDYLKAQIDLLAGQTQFSVGEFDAAYTHFQHTVENYPMAYDSYTALVALVDADVPVDDFQRGLVDYYAGKYGFALEAFDRYIASHPQNDGTVIYYRALTLQAQENYDQAIAGWTNFINNYSNNRYWLDAWEDKAYTQWNFLGQYDAAAQTLLNYVASVPASTSAPNELLQAGRIQERGGKLTNAALTWKRIADEYPNSSLVPQALFWAGIAYYRLQNYDDALVTFQRSLLFSTLPEDQARAQFWTGKAQQILGHADLAQEAWKQAAALDPTGYYSERARDFLFSRTVFDPPPAYNLNFDLIAEQQDAEAWIRLTFNLPADTDLSHISALGSDPRLVRGTELWRLGMYDEARLEFEDLRQAVSQDPADTYRLANYMLDLGLYRSAIVAARQVLTLAGMDTNAKAITAPAYFNHVRYGPYYQDLIIPAAKQNELDPLFLFAVVRQESAFEGFVRSDAGARGLMQIMPDTGQNIVSSYGWPPDYTSDDLYRPVVSVQLGSHLLMTSRKYFNGDLYNALASYNAGIGSAIIWNNLAGSDPDLYAEIVRFEQTRSYIRGIYENFVIYRTLYGTIP